MLARAVTPTLAKVYEGLVARAADFAFAGVVARVRERFEARVGSFSPADAWFEERSAALWDRVLCDAEFHGRLAVESRASFARDELDALGALLRAQRGLFEVSCAPHGSVDVTCLVTGAAFRLSKADDAGASLARAGDVGGAQSGLLDAHAIATPEGVALLPGMLVHPPEAREPITACLARAEALSMSPLDVLDALLAMRHRLAARSRMKAHQVYRAEEIGR
jgi:hypothetical protein